jgi:hypothetical protein
MSEQAIDWKTLVPEIVQMFVADEIDRYAIHVPWHDGDELAATNGHICIRGPWKDEYGPLPDHNEFTRPPYRKLRWRRSLYCDDPLPLVDFADLDVLRTSSCLKCAGGGLVTCEYEHEHDCPDCVGSGEVSNPLIVRWNGVVKINGHYVNRLQKEGARLFVHKIDSHIQPILAVWGEFQALLMPIQPEVEHDDDDILEVEPTDG